MGWRGGGRSGLVAAIVTVAGASFGVSSCTAAPTHPRRPTPVESIAVDATLVTDGRVSLRYGVAFVDDRGGTLRLRAPALAAFDGLRVNGRPVAARGETLDVEVDGRTALIETTLTGATQRYRDVGHVTVPVWPGDDALRKTPHTITAQVTVHLPAPPVRGPRWPGALDPRTRIGGTTVEARSDIAVDRLSTVSLQVPAGAVAQTALVRDDERGEYLDERDRSALERDGDIHRALAARQRRADIVDAAYWALVAAEVLVPLGIAGARLAGAARRRRRAGAGVPDPLVDPPDQTPPAVVALLATGGHDIGDEAVAATVLEMARRGTLSLDARGGGRWLLRVTGDQTAPGAALAEALAAAAAPSGVIEGPPLGIGRGGWWRVLRREVVGEARRLGLLRRRYASGLFVTAVVALAFTTAPLWLRSPALAAAGAIVAVVLGSLPFFGGYALTDAGLAARARWLAYGRHLRETGDLEDVDPPGHVIWDHNLAYAAALGAATRVVDELAPAGPPRRRAPTSPAPVALAFVVLLAVATLAPAAAPARAGAQAAPCAVGSRGDFRRAHPNGDLVQDRLRGRDLSCQDLAGMNFGQADLTGANLRHARLDGATLTQVHATGADLTGASAVKARFVQADLRNANFTGASLREADLTQATVDGAVLAGADLAGIPPEHLVKADRRGTPFAPATSHAPAECEVGSKSTLRATILDTKRAVRGLAGVDLSCQDLTGLELFATDLTGANLNRARLAATTLTGVSVRGATFIGADLSGARLMSADLAGLDLREADLAGADLFAAKLQRADLRKANLTRARLPSADLTGADLRAAVLDRADLRSARLANTDFRDASLRDANFTSARADGATFRGADLAGASGTLWLRGADLDGARNRPASRWRPWAMAAGAVLVALIAVGFLKRRSRGIAADAG